MATRVFDKPRMALAPRRTALAGPLALLRGWDEGYSVPSLGIAIHPVARGQGLGTLMMEYLHFLARQRGAITVRLRVHVENLRAIQLYQALGYAFVTEGDEYIVGKLQLAQHRKAFV